MIALIIIFDLVTLYFHYLFYDKCLRLDSLTIILITIPNYFLETLPRCPLGKFWQQSSNKARTVSCLICNVESIFQCTGCQCLLLLLYGFTNLFVSFKVENKKNCQFFQEQEILQILCGIKVWLKWDINSQIDSIKCL